MESGDFIHCLTCDAYFEVTWQFNPDIIGVEFCPFCGDEVENCPRGNSRDVSKF